MNGQNTSCLVGLLVLYCTASISATIPLSLLFVNSSCDGEGFGSGSVFPAAEMAVERVNSNSSLLQGYSLNLTVTQVCAYKYLLRLGTQIGSDNSSLSRPSLETSPDPRRVLTCSYMG